MTDQRHQTLRSRRQFLAGSSMIAAALLLASPALLPTMSRQGRPTIPLVPLPAVLGPGRHLAG